MNKVTPTQVLQMTNVLRSLGLNTSSSDTKIINKIIKYFIKNDIEFITLDSIYKNISIEYGLNIYTIRSNVNYALDIRNMCLSKTNFEKVFDYQYFYKTFEPKIFIE